MSSSNSSSKSQILLLYSLPHMLLETFPETIPLIVFGNTKPYETSGGIVHFQAEYPGYKASYFVVWLIKYLESTWVPSNCATQELVRLLSGYCTSYVEVLQRTGFCDTSPVQVQHHQRREPQIHYS